MKLENGEFDAVVTDWRLGDGDGRMVVQAAKAHARVPVIVVSGFIEDAYKAAKPQADLYLEKPADPKELLAILNALLKTPRKTEDPAF
jgi:DNA-binding response OmpR family regulator